MSRVWVVCSLMMFVGCSRTSVSTTRQRSVAACAPARSFGAVPDDDGDDGQGIQAALNACAGSVVELEAGRYRVVTPARPGGRPLAMLTVPENTSLEGVSATATVVEFSGDNGKLDWRGLQLASGVSIKRMRLMTNFVAGSTVEQTHVARVDGPARGIHLQDLQCFHPQNGSKSGDCFQVVGYAPDKLVWDVEVDHVDFQNTGRSGMSFHSGLRGSLRADGHWTTRIHDCHFGDISDQPIDGEGTGDTDGVEIDHDVFDYPANLESSAAVQIQASAHVMIHDNVLRGRGIDLYGCDECLLEHNAVDQVAPSFPAVQFRKKGSGTRFVDEVYSRATSAGPGPVVLVAQKLSAPDNVMFDHVRFTQRSAYPVISTFGIDGLDVLGSALTYDATAYVPELKIDALAIIGSGASVSPACTDNQVSGDNPGVRTTRIHLRDNTISGPYRATVVVSGSYCGTGTIEMVRNVATGPQQGLRCENATSGSTITGPVVFRDNHIPGNTCSLVP